MIQQDGQNWLLAALPEAEFAQLRPRLETVRLSYQQILHRPGEEIRQVYFPVSGIISQVVVMEDGGALETGVVGREGLAGVQACRRPAVAPNLAMVQMGGDALRLDGDNFLEAIETMPAFRDLILRYTVTVLNQTARVAACNRLHPIVERYARWLLLSQDRSGASVMPFTQEFLAIMLGVRRATVTAAAAVLQRSGLIRYLRGNIEILDRPGLEAAACECYAVMRRDAHMSVPD